MHLLAASRMDQRQFSRMQTLSVDPCGMRLAKAVRGPAVHGITQEGMAEACHMNTDLMRAPRFQAALDMTHAVKALQHPIMGDSIPRMRLGAAKHRHSLAVGGVTPDGGIDRSLILPQIADGNGMIDTADAVYLQLVRQRQMGRIVLGDDKQAARILVDTVDDAGTNNSADTRE